jgi:hypothetical protein
MSNPLGNYLVKSIAGSVVACAAHGWFTTRDLNKTAHQAMHGLFLGVWAPIAVPCMLLRPHTNRCTLLNKFHGPK